MQPEGGAPLVPFPRWDWRIYNSIKHKAQVLWPAYIQPVKQTFPGEKRNVFSDPLM